MEDSEFVRSRLEALNQRMYDLLQSSRGDAAKPYESLSSSETTFLTRLLRPNTYRDGTDTSERSIITQRITTMESRLLTTQFENSRRIDRNTRQYFDRLRLLNPILHREFVIFFYPLAFYERKYMNHENQHIDNPRFHIFQERIKESLIRGDTSRTPILSRIEQSRSIPISSASGYHDTTQRQFSSNLVNTPSQNHEYKNPNHAVETTSAMAGMIALPQSTSIKDLATTHWIDPTLESILVREILSICRGLSVQHIKFDSRSESYIIDPSLSLNFTVRDSILSLCELGWLFHRIRKFLTRIENASAGGVDVKDDGRSMVSRMVQALAYAIEAELVNYYGVLETIEAVAEKQCSLLRLRILLVDVIERMRLLANIVDHIDGLIGGALISRLYAYSRHGDPSINSMMLRLLVAVIEPLSQALYKWIIHGELEDPHGELFIGFSSPTSIVDTTGTPGQVRNIWRDTYFLNREMLPNFLPLPVAEGALLVGKNLNFIKICLQRLPKSDLQATLNAISTNLPIILNSGDGALHGSIRALNSEKSGKIRKSYRQINRSKKLGMYGRVITEGDDDMMDDEVGSIAVDEALTEDFILTRLHSLVDGEELKNSLRTLYTADAMHFHSLVHRLLTASNQALLVILDHGFNIRQHLLALRKFLLLGQGDFITCLMDAIGPELKKRAAQLFRHSLTSLLEGALRSSNAQYEPSYIIDRVGVRLLEAASGDSGWEVFSLDYAIDPPLNMIVHTEALAKYRIAFHMLWRLKRVEWSLSASWKLVFSFTHVSDRNTLLALRPILHRCDLCRAQMMHTVNNLCAFFKFEVLESAWSEFEKAWSNVNSLDELLVAHDKYLDSILDRGLLTPRHEVLHVKVQELLQSILRFCALEESVISDAIAFTARQQLSGQPEAIPFSLMNRIDDVAGDYSTHVDGLLRLLRKEADNADDSLRFLAFRLDFNMYYEKKRHHRPRPTTGGFAFAATAAAATGVAAPNTSTPGSVHTPSTISYGVPPRSALRSK